MNQDTVGWIDVTKSSGNYPDNRRQVLVCSIYGILSIAFYIGKIYFHGHTIHIWEDTKQGIGMHCDISHWQELPKPIYQEHPERGLPLQ